MKVRKKGEVIGEGVVVLILKEKENYQISGLIDVIYRRGFISVKYEKIM